MKLPVQPLSCRGKQRREAEVGTKCFRFMQKFSSSGARVFKEIRGGSSHISGFTPHAINALIKDLAAGLRGKLE